MVKPIPVYSSKAPPGFECPSSLKFEGNSFLQMQMIKRQPEVLGMKLAERFRDDELEIKQVNHNEEPRVVEREDDVVVTPATGINPKQGKKRALAVNKIMDSEIELQLEEEFQTRRTPSHAELSEMAEKYNIGKSVLRSWFCSRRQRQKKLEKVAGASRAKKKVAPSTNHALTNHSEFTSPGPKLIIPSPTHDITIEVPSINPKDRGSIIHKDYVMKTSST